MAMVKVGELNIEYYVEGSGPPLLMIMGLGGQAASWGEPFLEQIRPHFQTIRFSNRGTGLTDKPGGEYSVRLMADDAAGLLRELGIPRAHVLGISMGGMIAQELALNHPQAVHGLVLGCTFCGPAHGVHLPPKTLARLGQVGAMPLEQRIEQFWLVTVTQGFIDTRREFLDGIIQAHLATPTPWETFGRQFVAVQSFDTYDRLPQVQAPTLVIHGDRDQLVPVENADILHERISGSQVRIIPGVGHCFFWEKPPESAGAIIEFLKSAVPA
ncbi:MAG: alpha/beta hydrolase [Dehalococcoidia bacterium]|nr:alpha/beta hydrolase [Dehalococcoidia bacterium]